MPAFKASSLFISLSTGFSWGFARFFAKFWRLIRKLCTIEAKGWDLSTAGNALWRSRPSFYFIVNNISEWKFCKVFLIYGMAVSQNVEIVLGFSDLSLCISMRLTSWERDRALAPLEKFSRGNELATAIRRAIDLWEKMQNMSETL